MKEGGGDRKEDNGNYWMGVRRREREVSFRGKIELMMEEIFYSILYLNDFTIYKGI